MAGTPIFDVLVVETRDGYSAQVVNSSAGGELAAQPFHLPLDLGALPSGRDDVATWVEQARIVRRSTGGDEVAQARRLGTALFEQLFTGELLAGFRENRKALDPNQILRVRLRLPASLVALPWELLYDSRDGQFLALAPDLVLARYLDLPMGVEPLRLDGPLRVVVVAASPAELPPLDIQREWQRISAALESQVARGRIVLDLIGGPNTLDQLRARLREAAHVVHFVGHGDLDRQRGEGVLMFEDADGSTEPINAELLRVNLQKQRGQTRLVVLNACLGALPAGDQPFSSLGAALLRAGVPAVVAMQFAIPDEVAIDLARVFYAELAAGTPVDLAVNESRMQLYGRHPYRLDWVIPVLFIRATSGVLFEPSVPSAPPTEPASPPPPGVPTAPAPRSVEITTHPPRGGAARDHLQAMPLLAGAFLLLALCVLAVGLRVAQPRAAAPPPEQEPGVAVAGSPVTGQPAASPAPSVTGHVDSSSGGALPPPVFATATRALPPLSARNISNTPGRSDTVRVAVDATDALHVIWLDTTPRQGRGQTMLWRSLGIDGEWSPVSDLTPDLEYVTTPVFLVRSISGDLCLVLDTVTGIFSRCLTSGQWTPLERRGSTLAPYAPALGTDGALRQVGGPFELRYGDQRLDDGLAAVLFTQFVIDAAGNYHVVWERSGGVWTIEYRFSDDGGASWHPQQRLSSPEADLPQRPTLVADSRGAVHLAWSEFDQQVYRRWDAADGWGEPITFGARARGDRLSLATDSEGLPVAVWVGNCEVRYARRLADGAWSPVRVLNPDPSPSACATEAGVAIDGAGRQHIVWVAQGLDDSPDVYHATLDPGE